MDIQSILLHHPSPAGWPRSAGRFTVPPSDILHADHPNSWSLDTAGFDTPKGTPQNLTIECRSPSPGFLLSNYAVPLMIPWILRTSTAHRYFSSASPYFPSPFSRLGKQVLQNLGSFGEVSLLLCPFVMTWIVGDLVEQPCSFARLLTRKNVSVIVCRQKVNKRQ